MRILFIGNANRKHAGQRHFSYDTRLYNGFVRNGHFVYFFSDRDEVRDLSPCGIKSVGRRMANEKLLKIAAAFQPDAIILAHVDTIFPETFAEIRRRLPEIRIAQISVDAIYNRNNREKLAYRGQQADMTFVTTGGSALRSVAGTHGGAAFIPNFSDASIDTGRAFSLESPLYDVTCFMQARPDREDEEERLAIADGLAMSVDGLRVCYGGWGDAPALRDHAYLDALGKSAMGLNLSKKISDNFCSTFKTRYLYSSDRIAHFMGNGVMTLTQTGFGLEDLYDSSEIVFFEALEDLSDKVGYYKRNPAARSVIAEKGWRKAHNEFNVTLVTRYVIERLFGQNLSRDYCWPTTIWKGV